MRVIFRRFFILATVSFLALFKSAFAENLVQVYQDALASDPTFKQARATYQAAKENLPIAWSAYTPQITATAFGQRNFQTTNPVAPGVTQQGLENDFYSYGYALSLQQPIFNAILWANIKAASASVKAAYATYLAAAQNLMQRVSLAYFNVLLANDTLSYDQASERALLLNLETSQQQFKVGLIAITDVYDAQSKYAQSVSLEISDRNVLDDQIENLRAITGKKYTVLTGLKGQVPLLNPEPNNIESWVDMATQNNYLLISEEYSTVNFREQIESQAGNWLPQVNFIASDAGTRTVDQAQTNALPFSQTVISGVWDGLQVSLPLFNRGINFVPSSTNQARYNYLSQVDQMEITYRTTINDTRQNFLGILTGIGKVRADKQTITFAQKSLEATRAGYVVGTRTMVDVLNSITTLYQSLQAYAADQYNYINSIIGLKFNAGMLSVEDLAGINDWLKKSVKLPINPGRYGASTKAPPDVTLDISKPMRAEGDTSSSSSTSTSNYNSSTTTPTSPTNDTTTAAPYSSSTPSLRLMRSIRSTRSLRSLRSDETENSKASTDTSTVSPDTSGTSINGITDTVPSSSSNQILFKNRIHHTKYHQNKQVSVATKETVPATTNEPSAVAHTKPMLELPSPAQTLSSASLPGKADRVHSIMLQSSKQKKVVKNSETISKTTATVTHASLPLITPTQKFQNPTSQLATVTLSQPATVKRVQSLMLQAPRSNAPTHKIVLKQVASVNLQLPAPAAEKLPIPTQTKASLAQSQPTKVSRVQSLMLQTTQAKADKSKYKEKKTPASAIQVANSNLQLPMPTQTIR